MNDRTEHPLTDEQFVEWLDGAASAEVRAHLESCAPCWEEAHALQDGIARYAIALRREAAQAQSSRRTAEFAPARAVAHRLRWIGAGVLAVLLAGQTAWMMRQRPGAQSLPRPTAAAPASPQPATSMSDDELLQAVNNDVSDEVPEALAPVGAITVARNRIASEVQRESETQKVKQGENR
jgi:hypothetical protein